MLCFLGFFVFLLWLDSHDEMERDELSFPADGGATANSARGY